MHRTYTLSIIRQNDTLFSDYEKMHSKQICVQPRVGCRLNMTLPAFAAERRAAAPLLLSARR